MTQEDFMTNVLANAQRLCSPSGDKMIRERRPDAPKSKADVDPESFGGMGSAQDDAWDRMFLSEAAYDDNSPSAQKKEVKQMPITQASATRSRVPDFIKESMLSKVIDTSGLSANPLDRMDLSKLSVKQNTPAQTVITEQQVPQQVATVPSGIDYPLIRTIINECIENKFKEYGLTKGQLNENTLKSIHLKGGTINIVDNSGNVYSAKLKLEGNVNKK